MHRIGLISDTHGLLRPEALKALRGCEHIIHAGDIGGPDILEALSSVAPVTAVRGNNDTDSWASDISETERLKVGPVQLYVLHDLKQLTIAPAMQQIDVVIAGHSHKPAVEQRETWLFVNPGSAGPRRFKLPVTVGELLITERSVQARIIELSVEPSVPRRRTAKTPALHRSRKPRFTS